MKRSLRLFLLAVTLPAATCAVAQDRAPDIDKVNGSITALAGRAYGRLETVNGGIHVEAGATAGKVETVNGGIDLGDRAAARSLSTVNGGIRIGRDARIAGGVETVNGGISSDRGSRIEGAVSTVNGGIGLVGTEVRGRIDTVSGDITVGAGSRVAGGIVVHRQGGNVSRWFGRNKVPKVLVGPGAVVDGPLVFEREVKLYVHRSARIGTVRGATAIRYDGDRAPAG